MGTCAAGPGCTGDRRRLVRLRAVLELYCVALLVVVVSVTSTLYSVVDLVGLDRDELLELVVDVGKPVDALVDLHRTRGVPLMWCALVVLLGLGFLSLCRRYRRG